MYRIFLLIFFSLVSILLAGKPAHATCMNLWVNPPFDEILQRLGPLDEGKRSKLEPLIFSYNAHARLSINLVARSAWGGTAIHERGTVVDFEKDNREEIYVTYTSITSGGTLFARTVKLDEIERATYQTKEDAVTSAMQFALPETGPQREGALKIIAAFQSGEKVSVQRGGVSGREEGIIVDLWIDRTRINATMEVRGRIKTWEIFLDPQDFWHVET